MSILADDRAVEGMPIRLVVAVAVGAAAMALLVPMLEGVEQHDRPTVTVEPARHQIVLGSETAVRTVDIGVVTDDGRPIRDATVVLSSGSAPLVDGPHTLGTGPESSEVTVSIGESPAADLTVAFRATQQRGTIEIDVIPPDQTTYRRGTDHPELTVTAPQ